MCRCFVDFGLAHANLYNLMFTWHVPKFRDYLGTDMEPAARLEMETALSLSQLFIDALRACGNGGKPMPEENARFLMIQIWCQAHGYIAGINNTLLDYMHKNPIVLKDRLIAKLVESVQAGVENNGRRVNR